MFRVAKCRAGLVGAAAGPHFSGMDRDDRDAESAGVLLGEDLAGPQEIMLTERAHEALKDASFGFAEKNLSVSGLSLKAYLVKRESANITR